MRKKNEPTSVKLGEGGEMKVVRYGIAEKFLSIQGEGKWAGTSMKFIRLAGCSVGKDLAICKSMGGTGFQCDTDYKLKKRESVERLVSWVGDTKHVCITGGEPFDHNLEPLVKGLLGISDDLMVHIETSGTRPVPKFISDAPVNMSDFPSDRLWITVSPKVDCLWHIWEGYANEVKWLVSSRDANKYRIDEGAGVPDYVFVQPIFDEDYKKNLEYAIQICHDFPGVRLSLQTHKWMGVR